MAFLQTLQDQGEIPPSFVAEMPCIVGRKPFAILKTIKYTMMKKYPNYEQLQQRIYLSQQSKYEELLLFYYLLTEYEVQMDEMYYGKAKVIADGIRPWIEVLEQNKSPCCMATRGFISGFNYCLFRRKLHEFIVRNFFFCKLNSVLKVNCQFTLS